MRKTIDRKQNMINEYILGLISSNKHYYYRFPPFWHQNDDVFPCLNALIAHEYQLNQLLIDPYYIR